MPYQYPNLQISFVSPQAGTSGYTRWFRNHYIEDATLPYTLEATLRSTNGNRGTSTTTVPVMARIVVLQGPGPGEPEDTRTVLLSGVWKAWDGTPWTLELTESLFDGVRPLAISMEIDPEFRDGTHHCHVISRPLHMDPIPADRTTARYLFVGSHRWRDGEFNWQGLGAVWYPGFQPEVNSYPYKVRNGAVWDLNTNVNKFYAQSMNGETFNHVKSPQFARGEEWRFGFPDEATNALVDASGGLVQYHKNNFQFTNAGATLGLSYDGPRGHGNVAVPCAGFVEADDGLVVCSAIGRIAKVDINGNTTTIVGHRAIDGGLSPMRNYTSTVVDDEYEFVGSLDTAGMTTWDHIWDVIPDPNDSNILYVAATDNHRVDRIDRTTGSITVFAGSPEGLAGYVNGAALDARFDSTRGLAIQGNTMYVGDAVNQAIRTIDMTTREVGTLVQSAEVIDPHTLGSHSAVRTWSQDGAFGTAKFMHPQHIRFTSDGSLISPMHHERSLLEFNLNTSEVTTLIEEIPGAAFSDESQGVWYTLHIDKDGIAGPVDTMYYGGWEHLTDRVWDRQGNEVPVFSRGWNDDGTSSSTGFDAAYNRRASQGYPQMAVPGPGCFWAQGVSGAGLLRVTPTSTEAERSVDATKYHRGFDLWKLTPDVWQPSLSLMHGPRGHNMLGNFNIEDLGLMTKSELDTWLQSEYSRTLSPTDLDDLHYYVRHNSITGRNWSTAQVEDPDDGGDDGGTGNTDPGSFAEDWLDYSIGDDPTTVILAGDEEPRWRLLAPAAVDLSVQEREGFRLLRATLLDDTGEGGTRHLLVLRQVGLVESSEVYVAFASSWEAGNGQHVREYLRVQGSSVASGSAYEFRDNVHRLRRINDGALVTLVDERGEQPNDQDVVFHHAAETTLDGSGNPEIRGRMWAGTNDEPGTYLIDHTDTNAAAIPEAGRVGVGWQHPAVNAGNGIVHDIFFIGLGWNGTAAPRPDGEIELIGDETDPEHPALQHIRDAEADLQLAKDELQE